jgi:hypothetical protein
VNLTTCSTLGIHEYPQEEGYLSRQNVKRC